MWIRQIIVHLTLAAVFLRSIPILFSHLSTGIFPVKICILSYLLAFLYVYCISILSGFCYLKSIQPPVSPCEEHRTVFLARFLGSLHAFPYFAISSVISSIFFLPSSLYAKQSQFFFCLVFM